MTLFQAQLENNNLARFRKMPLVNNYDTLETMLVQTSEGLPGNSDKTQMVFD